MGKTEKIVVLSVLFVIAVLFVWSLDQGGAGETVDPRADGAEVARGAGEGPSVPMPPLSQRSAGSASAGPVVQSRPHPGPGVADDPQAADTNGPLLIAEVGGPEPRPVAPAIVLRPDWDVVTAQGLRATVDPEVFAADARAGDTFETVALRYYGDPAKARLLRRYNEGTTPAEGVVLLVPAVDRLPAIPDVREVEVLDGEGLWHVAKRVYGSGARWTELYEANRDRIPNKDVVRPGTLLRVPMD